MPAATFLTLSNAQVAIEAVATLAFALSGLIEAARKRLDAVGVCVVAGLAAFGDGTPRDILLRALTRLMARAEGLSSQQSPAFPPASSLKRPLRALRAP